MSNTDDCRRMVDLILKAIDEARDLPNGSHLKTRRLPVSSSAVIEIAATPSVTLDGKPAPALVGQALVEHARATVRAVRDAAVAAIRNDSSPETTAATPLGEQRVRVDHADGSQYIASFGTIPPEDLPQWPEWQRRVAEGRAHAVLMNVNQTVAPGGEIPDGIFEAIAPR